jgi:asparagine synthase (glutamine-hydrolysing)
MLCAKLLPHTLRQPLKKLTKKPSTTPSWLNLKLLQVEDREPMHGTHQETVIGQSCQQVLHTSLPMLLHWADRNSMAHSVESRTPFLDYRLVEFCLSLPAEYKIAQGRTKRILRDTMRSILPSQVNARTDKMGFPTAEEEWVRTQEKFKNKYKQAIERTGGIVLPSAHNLLDEIIQGRRPFSHLPWRILSFAHWLDRFAVCIPTR